MILPFYNLRSCMRLGDGGRGREVGWGRSSLCSEYKSGSCSTCVFSSHCDCLEKTCATAALEPGGLLLTTVFIVHHACAGHSPVAVDRGGEDGVSALGEVCANTLRLLPLSAAAVALVPMLSSCSPSTALPSCLPLRHAETTWVLSSTCWHSC